MNRQRWMLLLILLGFFAVVLALVIWNAVVERQTHFAAGTDPTLSAQHAPPQPLLPTLRPDDPSRGSKQPAAIQIVEFSDYACLDCRVDEVELQQVLQTYGDAVRLVWRDFPSGTERDDGWIAPAAARCAGSQGKFWEMHDALFQTDSFSLPSLKKTADGLRLDVDKFTACLTAPQLVQNIYHDLQDAQDHHLRATPTFFIGNDILSGAVSAAQLSVAIERAAITQRP